MNDAADIHALSGAYALDALDPEARLAFERHLASCEPCREELQSLTEAVAAMADDAQAAPREAIRAGVLAAIRDVRPLPPEVDADPPVDISRRSRRSHATRWLAVAAAVLAVAVVGLAWRSVNLSSQLTDLTASNAQVTAVLTAPDATTATGVGSIGGRATVVVSPSLGQAVLVADSLASITKDQTYQAWYVGADGSAQSAGLVAASTGSMTMLQGNPAGAAAVGLTVEPAGGSDQPTTDPVLAVVLPSPS